MKTALTIAGSDSSGGAGIQADMKTMLANGVFSMSAITALTAQNTTGVKAIQNTTPEMLSQQLDCIFTDIFPNAVKIGMLPSVELIDITARKLTYYQAEHIVLDPVMIATSGTELIPEKAVSALKEMLIPLAEVITPNIPEAEILSGMAIHTEKDMEQSAEKLMQIFHCAVLVKGGHAQGEANDFLITAENRQWFHGERIANPNTHGTGCTLSSAISANLAKGFPLPESVARAKNYLSGALAAMLNLGKGSGPLAHGYALNSEFIQEKCTL